MYVPWRLLLQVISLPGVVGSIGMLAVYESPKFLLSQGREEETMEVLRTMYSWNVGGSKDTFPVSLYKVKKHTNAFIKHKSSDLNVEG